MLTGWSLFGACVGIDFGIQAIGCVFAILLKTEKFYDLLGSLTYLTLVVLSLA
jgi:hypothetical protein